MVGPGGPRGRRVCLLACGALLTVLATGCAQSVPGTPHPEGEGPAAPAEPSTSAEAAPPTDFQEPSGRPTVTVEPDGTEPVVPGPLSPAPPTSAAPPTTTRDRGGPPLAAPDGTDRSGGSGGGTGSAGSGGGTGSSGSGGGAGSGGGSGGGSGAGSGGGSGAGSGGSGAGSGGGGTGGPGSDGRPRTAAPVASTPLTADVLDDECLLDAAASAALLGGPVGKPAEAAVIRPDGTSTRSCYVTSRAGTPAPTAAVNVYRVNRGTPAAFVRAAAGGRAVPGIGEAAVLLDTVGGSTLQVATSRYLVTVNVVDATPSAERWAAAGRTVVARLGSP